MDLSESSQIMTKKTFAISIAMVFSLNCSVAQEEAEENNEERPSWSTGIPQRTDVPKTEISKPDIESELGVDLELDMSDFGLPKRVTLDPDPVVEPSSEAELKAESDSLQTTDQNIEINQSNIPETESFTEQLSEPESDLLQTSESQTEQGLENTQEPSSGENLISTPDPQPLLIEESQNMSESENEFEVGDEVVKSTALDVDSSGYQWKVLKSADLNYPVEAYREKRTGWVDVLVTINPAGEVVDVKEEGTSRRGRIFVASALNSLKRYSFDPPRDQGISENISRVYRIAFKP